VESYEEALVRLNEEHESWLLHPCMITHGIGSAPGIRLICKCGTVVAFITNTVDEDFVYDRWGKHVEQEIDKLANDYPDEDEVDDIIFVDLDDEELETEI